jgi:peptide/nickel transport system ATP-binding protein
MMVTNSVGTQFIAYDNERPVPLLEVKSLSVDYQAANGTVHAVTDVSFTLQRGQVLGLAGESGSGKSTLAYAIARLLRPPADVTQGEIWYYPRQGDAVSRRNVSGEDVELKPLKGQEGMGEDNEKVDILEFSSAQLRAFRWRELSIVFQSAMNALNPVATIKSQVRDVLKAHSPTMTKDMCKLRAIELLRLVGIAPDRLRSYPHELSGGMRQRAIIAIALALSPEIIIMDEPTTALDVVVQRDILNEIMSLRHRLDFSVIFITHDLSLLLEMTDKVAIMYAGRIVEMASQHELYTQARHPYTIGLLNSFPTLHGPRRRMTGIPGTPPDLRAVPAGCAFHPRCQFAFDACWHTLPALAAPAQAFPGQKVACHLYDHTINPAGIPTDLRERYLAAASEDEIELDKPATIHPHPTIPTGKGEAQ